MNNFQDRYKVIVVKRFVIFITLLGIVGTVWAEYPYWVEDVPEPDGLVGANYINVWTKVSVPAHTSKTIYLISEEGHSPNGDAVFEFFDDFDGAELDTTKWDSDINTYLISNSILNTQSPYCIVSKQIFSGNIIAEMKWKDDEFSRSPSLMFLKTDRNNGVFAGYSEWGSPYDNDFIIFTTWNYNSNFNYVVKVSSGDILIDTTKWHKSTAKYVDGQFIATLDDDTTIQYGYAMTDYYVALGSPTGRTYNEEYDYIFVRKYAENEPEITKVEQIQDGYRFYIHNPNNQDLNGFQIGIPASGTVDGTNYDLNIADKGESLNIITYDDIERKPIPTIYINSNQTATATLTINGVPMVLSVNGTSKTLDVETTNLIETYGVNGIKLLNTNPKSSVHLSVKYNYNTPIYVAKLRAINISAYTDYS